MSELIGKRFKRNKYGLSLWEDTVTEVIYERSYDLSLRIDKSKPYPYPDLIERLKRRKHAGFKLIPKVLGKNTLKSYDFNEIIFYNG